MMLRLVLPPPMAGWKISLRTILFLNQSHVLQQQSSSATTSAAAAGAQVMTFACPACRKVFESTETRELHTLSCFRKRKVKCQLCLSQLLSNAHRLVHLKMAHDKFLCRICVKEFNSVVKLNEHEKNTSCSAYINTRHTYDVDTSTSDNTSSAPASATQSESTSSLGPVAVSSNAVQQVLGAMTNQAS